MPVMTIRTEARVLAAVAAVMVGVTLGVTSAAAEQRGGAAPAAGPRQESPVFVLDNGRYTAFDVPFGQAGGDAAAIDNLGRIAGGYVDPVTGCVRGFLRDDRGRFTRLDVPDAAGGTTQPVRLDDRGRIVGNYRPGAACRDAPPRGFLRDERGRYTTIHVPGARQTQALGINNRGQIVGDYGTRAPAGAGRATARPLDRGRGLQPGATGGRTWLP
jgi:hypothetical protein